MKSEKSFPIKGKPLKLKLCIVGDAGTGKEAFSNHFLSKAFISNGESTRLTIGVDLYFGNISINTDKGIVDCRIQLWELTGEERFRFLYPKYFKGTKGFLLFFDLANRESFLHLEDWIKLIQANVKNEVPFLLVGNKSDPEKSAIFPKEFDGFIRKYNLDYIESSTLTKEGIIDSFYSITSLITGVDIQSKYFISKKTNFHPSINPPPNTTSISTLTPQDIHNLTQRIVRMMKMESVDEPPPKNDVF